MDTIIIYRVCTVCHKSFPATLEYFYARREGKYGLSSKCRSCDYAKKVNWMKKNPEKVKNSYKKSYEKLKRIQPSYQSDYRRRKCREVKAIVFNAYGGKCACCGEDIFEFLSIDHINGDGSSHRKKNSPKSSFRTINVYKSIIRDNFPNNIQILCFNCHMAKDFYGECPHGNMQRKYDR